MCAYGSTFEEILPNILRVIFWCKQERIVDLMHNILQEFKQSQTAVIQFTYNLSTKRTERGLKKSQEK